MMAIRKIDRNVTDEKLEYEALLMGKNGWPHLSIDPVNVLLTMSMMESVRLRCNSCGNVWKSRNPDSEMRQCSKCRSMDLSEIAEDETMSVSERRPSFLGRRLTQGVLNAEAAFLSTDSNIIAKRKK